MLGANAARGWLGQVVARQVPLGTGLCRLRVVHQPINQCPSSRGTGASVLVSADVVCRLAAPAALVASKGNWRTMSILAPQIRTPRLNQTEQVPPSRPA